MVKINVWTESDYLELEADKYEVRGDLLYVYDNEYKDSELTDSEKFALTNIIKFWRIEFTDDNKEE